MARILIAYYSLSGHTHAVAQAIARRLDADVDRIRDARPRISVRSGLEAVFRLSPRIAEPEARPSAYDLVLIGSPVWAASMAAPMRTYLRRMQGEFGKTAFFVTQASSNGPRAIRDMAKLAGVEPAGALVVSEADLKKGRMEQMVEDFVRKLPPVG